MNEKSHCTECPKACKELVTICFENEQVLVQEFYPKLPCENCGKIGSWVGDTSGMVGLCCKCLKEYDDVVLSVTMLEYVKW